jgi:hypothetical protein
LFFSIKLATACTSSKERISFSISVASASASASAKTQLSASSQSGKGFRPAFRHMLFLHYELTADFPGCRFGPFEMLEHQLVVRAPLRNEHLKLSSGCGDLVQNRTAKSDVAIVTGLRAQQYHTEQSVEK